MRYCLFLVAACLLQGSALFSQGTVTGTFTLLKNQQIKLVGFEGFDTYVIDSVKADERGSFELSFDVRDNGMGYLVSVDERPFIIILSPGEDLRLEGEALELIQTIKIVSGLQNRLFGQYAIEHVRREQALSAWDYLERIYRLDSLFAVHDIPKTAIETEKRRIKDEDRLFLEGIDSETYVSWYLPVRGLVSSVATVAQYRTEEIPGAIETFRSIDYTDGRLYKSGLLRETIEAHFWLIENSGRSLDSVFIEMNVSIDRMLVNLVSDERKFNEITDFLFRLLESRSLLGSSEYLAIRVLNDTRCTVDADLASQMESYRAMKPGNIAPDFDFSGDILAPGYEAERVPQRLSELKSDYVAVVFGASWCPACHEELLRVTALYPKWKGHNVEVLFVSLDEEKQLFIDFAGVFPFISVCDYSKWESPAAKAYHLFATPTIYLLDSKREIILRPNSVQHLDSWIDWFLVKGQGDRREER